MLFDSLLLTGRNGDKSRDLYCSSSLEFVFLALRLLLFLLFNLFLPLLKKNYMYKKLYLFEVCALLLILTLVLLIKKSCFVFSYFVLINSISNGKNRLNRRNKSKRNAIKTHSKEEEQYKSLDLSPYLPVNKRLSNNINDHNP